MESSQIRDINLYPSGQRKISWAKQNAPLLCAIQEDFAKNQYFKGINVVVSVHLEAKTAYLAKVLKSGGANVSVAGSNPLSTQDDVAAALVKDGISVYSWYGATEEEYNRHLNMALDIKPNIVIDDGGDLVNLLHTTRSQLLPNIFGGCEETTTGVLRLKSRAKAGELKFPMIAVNDAYCKYLFDNRYGTGQSVWNGINKTTNLIVAGKKVVVAGYGWCGKGVAMRAKGLGANVIVTEVNAVKAIEAVLDGFTVLTMEKAAEIGDVFVTVTGCDNVIKKEHFGLMKSGVILCNAGHFDCEINVKELKNLAKSVVDARENIQGYVLENGHQINLLGEGRLVNLACGDGHPVEIMDQSFALQALCAKEILQKANTLENKVYGVPIEIDNYVASLKLKSMGVEIDQLTAEQIAYLG